MRKALFIIIILIASQAFAIDTLSTQKIIRTGLAEALLPTEDDTTRYLSDGIDYIHIKNSNVSTRTITVISTADIRQTVPVGMAASNTVVTVPASTGNMKIGPFPISGYGDIMNYITYVLSDTAGITVGIFEID